MVNFSRILRSTKSNPVKAVCLSAVLVFFASSSAFADDGISCTGPGGRSLSLQLVGQGAGTPVPIYKVTDPTLRENDRKAIRCTKNGSSLVARWTEGASSSLELWDGDLLTATLTFVRPDNI